MTTIRTGVTCPETGASYPQLGVTQYGQAQPSIDGSPVRVLPFHRQLPSGTENSCLIHIGSRRLHLEQTLHREQVPPRPGIYPSAGSNAAAMALRCPGQPPRIFSVRLGQH